MTKEEAKKALNEGKKVSHKYFSDKEYIVKTEGKLQDERGYLFSEALFWMDRSSAPWKEGWKLYETKK